MEQLFVDWNHEMKITRVATLVLLLVAACHPVCGQQPNSQFDKPVYLKVGDKPMNEDGEMMYPSPVLMDIDRDGDTELVIGTIFGVLFVSENSATGGGDPVWEAPQLFNSTENEPLRLNNW